MLFLTRSAAVYGIDALVVENSFSAQRAVDLAGGDAAGERLDDELLPLARLVDDHRLARVGRQSPDERVDFAVEISLRFAQTILARQKRQIGDESLRRRIAHRRRRSLAARLSESLKDVTVRQEKGKQKDERGCFRY